MSDAQQMQQQQQPPSASVYASEYHRTLERLPKATSDLLQEYSGIPAEDQLAHVVAIRDEAYARFPYPCIGNFRFVDLDLAAHRAYREHVLGRLLLVKKPGRGENSESEALFLDLGTCLGQDLRKLVHDGASPDRLWASDVEPEFIELGFRLFRDEGRLSREHFLCPGDLLAASGAHISDGGEEDRDMLKVLDDRVTILHMTAVFHLFSLEDQKRFVQRCLRLLREDTGRPVLVIGGQVGSRTPGNYVRHGVRVTDCADGGGGSEAEQQQRQNAAGPGHSHRYRHDRETWQKMSEGVCGGESWRDRVKSVEAKSTLLRRVRSTDEKSEDTVAFEEPGPDDDEMLWHMFEVWVTFA